ncbi:MAG TPA: hypothetical protein HA362_08235 [Nanoarchaeota archaeon]|nr:hypothetical protein [Nanoarchaeota archaeon]
MVQLHYDAPKGSLGRILGSIISHLTPDLKREDAGVTEIAMGEVRRELKDNDRQYRQATIWNNLLGYVANGLGICNATGKEEIMAAAWQRYGLPEEYRQATGFVIRIYGTETGAPSRHPLILDLKERPSMHVEDYDSNMLADIQMLRLLWDFFGKGVEKAGYRPIAAEGRIFSFSQPELDKKLELISAAPTVPAGLIANNMVLGMINVVPQITGIMLRNAKGMPQPSIEDILKRGR